jgi:hypothetical protein
MFDGSSTESFHPNVLKGAGHVFPASVGNVKLKPTLDAARRTQKNVDHVAGDETYKSLLESELQKHSDSYYLNMAEEAQREADKETQAIEELEAKKSQLATTLSNTIVRGSEYYKAREYHDLPNLPQKPEEMAADQLLKVDGVRKDMVDFATDIRAVEDLPADSQDDTESEPKALLDQSMRKRTRTGCLICRKRRIKCDEERPMCGNCIEVNLVCGGYGERLVFGVGGPLYEPADVGLFDLYTSDTEFTATTEQDEDFDPHDEPAFHIPDKSPRMNFESSNVEEDELIDISSEPDIFDTFDWPRPKMSERKNQAKVAYRLLAGGNDEDRQPPQAGESLDIYHDSSAVPPSTQDVQWELIHYGKYGGYQYSDSSMPSSYANSVLSTTSLASSATDLSKHTGYSPLQIARATKELIVILQDDSALAPLYKRAIVDTSIGPEKLERNLRRLFRTYADHLGKGAGDTLELLASQLVRAKARAVAQSIVQKHGTTMDTRTEKETIQPREQDQSSDEETEARPVDESVFEDLIVFREFLVGN